MSNVLERAEQYSRYVARLAQDCKHSCLFEKPFSREEMASFLNEVRDEDALNRNLRELRKAVMLRTIGRDLSGLADMEEVVGTMSDLAEISIAHALALHAAWMTERYGLPVGESSGTPQHLHVVAMGKLGGRELNASSDIDLVFVYPEDGETAQGMSCQEYFAKLGKRLISSLQDMTPDGFVFRVDMRLRPYGDSGALASSFAMLEDYFLTQGREWERYAWIKGRSVTGNRIEDLMKLVHPFVFRKYLDYGAFGSMRELHAQIRQQVKRLEMSDNIKLGPGGIREIEFIAQVFQLIRGGRDSTLRIRPTLKVLDLLAAKRMLPEKVADELKEAYVFLRNLEHRLQYLDDAQTQTLPRSEEDRLLVAQSMGFPDYAAFLHDLDERRQKVEFHFESVFADSGDQETIQAWAQGGEEKLAELGFKDPEQMLTLLNGIREGSRYRHLPASSQKRVDELIPLMAKAASKVSHPDLTLKRMSDLLESVSRRSSYLALLKEYPHTLEQVAKLASASPWASEYLRLHPILLDELLDSRTLYGPVDWAGWAALLDAKLDGAEGDVEAQMGALRDAHHAAVFQLLAKDMNGLLRLEILSDHLSYLADLILARVLDLCWRGLRGRHRDAHAFAVIGYGKLGGKELGYASDLDLVFLYEDDHPNAQEIYARLAQRINTWLTSVTPSGILYETDLRLRPNGASGLLVSPVAAFEAYQMNEAWVWEHQALTRGRYVAGNAETGEQFEAIRRKVLMIERNREKLKADVLSMRQKMLDGHPNKTALFDIKHDRGGIVDVEFAVQYLVLAYACDHPVLVENVGNIALLGKMGEIGLISRDVAARAQEAYREFRRLQHKLRLAGEAYARIEKQEIAIQQDAVLHLWDTVFA